MIVALIDNGSLEPAAHHNLRRVAAALSVIAGAMVATNYVFALIALPAVEPFKPVVPIVAEIDARARPGEPPPVVASEDLACGSDIRNVGERFVAQAALADHARACPRV